VNEGVTGAAKLLQQALGAVVDGDIGPKTLAAVQAAYPRALIEHMCELRLAHKRKKPSWVKFGRGWTNRIKRVEARALSLLA
jgi:lysozyme family protein